MGPLWFAPPVYVKTKRPGIRNGVSHVEGTAEELMAWDTKGPRWTKAVQSCVDAFEGRGVEVREAFEAAAKEANMYLSPE
ncbi:DUF982 domain-containing protein [Mesorhizobium sp. M0816]|uniref:DUF982 domain-containing protein n=1 Tax=Mesorhizobium sp. M0816 TaxID=2957006 RepID=UPI00333862FF